MNKGLSSLFNRCALVAAAFWAYGAPLPALAQQATPPVIQHAFYGADEVAEPEHVIALRRSINKLTDPDNAAAGFAEIEVMAGHDNPVIRADTARLLMNVYVAAPSYLDRTRALLQRMMTDPDPSVREKSLSSFVNNANTAQTLDESLQLLRRKLQDPDPRTVQDSLRILRETVWKQRPRTGEIFDIMRESANHPADDVRRTLIRLSGEIALSDNNIAPSIVRFLIDRARNEKPDVAIVALERLDLVARRDMTQSPLIVGFLESLIAGDPRSKTGEAAARAIMQIGTGNKAYGDRALGLALDALDKGSTEQRGWAARQTYFITRTSNPDWLPIIAALQEAMRNDRDRAVRDNAARSIIDIAGHVPSFTGESLEAAATMLGSSSDLPITNASQHLQKLATGSTPFAARATDILVEAIATVKPSQRARILGAVESILKIKSGNENRIFALVTPRLQDTDAGSLTTTLRIIALIAQNEPALRAPALGATENLLTYRQAGIRNEAIKAVAAIGQMQEDLGRRALDFLARAYDKVDPDSKIMAGEHMGTVGAAWPGLYDETRLLLADRAALVNNASGQGLVRGLGKLAAADENTARAILPVFETLAQNQNTVIRASVATSLLEPAVNFPALEPEITPLLQHLAQDKEYGVKNSAQRSLNEIRRLRQFRIDQDHIALRARLETALPQAIADEAEAAGLMTDALDLTQARDVISRRRAVEITGQIARAHAALAPQALPRLAELAQDQDKGVRLAVTQSLGMIALQHRPLTDQVRAPLQTLAADSDAMIARLAQTALGRLTPPAKIAPSP